MLLVMGAIFFAVYYFLFRLVIRWWNLRTPGREPEDEFEAEQAANLEDAPGAVAVPGGIESAIGGGTTGSTVATKASVKAEQLIAAFGGRENLVNVDACITRLRMEVADKDKVNKPRLKALGAAGVIEVGNNVQAIFGTQAELLKNDIKDAMAGPAPVAAPVDEPVAEAVPAAPPAPPVVRTAGSTPILAPVQGRAVPMSQVPDPTFAQGIVGHGAAIDPPREIVDAVAPISGKVLQMFPHAYIIVSDDNVGVLVHLGLDTVQLNGEGFTRHVSVGDRVVVGQPVITYDVPAVVAAGRNPIVPVVVMEKKPEDIVVADLVAAGGELCAAQLLLVVNG
jgi:PTS system N-acetylglucosamine-specific IIC component